MVVHINRRYGRAGEVCKLRKGRQLWRSDGTELGTYRVDDVSQAGPTSAHGLAPAFLTEFNDFLYFQVCV